MIIDADVHISPSLESGNSIKIEKLLRRMDEANVDKSLTWIQPPYIRSKLNKSLEYLGEVYKNNQDRVLGFGWADPNLGQEESKDTIKRCIEDYNFYGVKLNGAQNTFYIDDEEYSLPLIELIASYGKAVAFHVGADVLDYTHPYRVEKVSKLFPNTPILMVHMGGAAFADYSEAAIEVAKRCPNVTLIGSAVRSIPIIKAIRELGADRVAFGSDTPFELMDLEVLKYEAILKKHFTPEDREMVMSKTIMNALGLKA